MIGRVCWRKRETLGERSKGDDCSQLDYVLPWGNFTGKERKVKKGEEGRRRRRRRRKNMSRTHPRPIESDSLEWGRVSVSLENLLGDSNAGSTRRITRFKDLRACEERGGGEEATNGMSGPQGL